MDLNNLLKSGMRECGRVLKLLPKDEIGSPTEYMMKIIREETLPSLDIIHPMIHSSTDSLLICTTGSLLICRLVFLLPQTSSRTRS